MQNIIKDFKNLLKNNSELVINFILIILTVIITVNCIDFLKNKKDRIQEKPIKKQIQQYDNEKLIEPTTTKLSVSKSDGESDILSKEEKQVEQISTKEEVEKPIVKTSSISEITPQSMNIMGYEEVNVDKAITFIIGLVGEENIDKIKLNGASLNFHISNTNKAAKAENVNAYFVLSQQLLETGNFKFENSCVKPEYYNFAGLGATDANPNPNKFFSNYEGQLAQVQHLKAYASNENLNVECKDQRFNLLVNKRGTAKNAAELANKWASNAEYGELLAEMYNQFHSTEINSDLVSKYKYKEF